MGDAIGQCLVDLYPSYNTLIEFKIAPIGGDSRCIKFAHVYVTFEPWANISDLFI